MLPPAPLIPHSCGLPATLFGPVPNNAGVNNSTNNCTLLFHLSAIQPRQFVNLPVT